MKTKLLFLSLLIFSLSSFSQVYDFAKRAGGTLDDEIFDICHDAADNIYTTGIFEGTADLDPGTSVVNFTALGAGDLFFAKSDVNGNYIWAKTIGSGGDEEGLCIKVDALGNIYLSGLFSGTADFDPGPGTANLTSLGGFDIYIAKYDNNGNYIWAKNIGSTGNVDDYPSHMVLSATGDMYIIGQFGGSCDFDPGPATAMHISTGGWDVFFARYDSSGNYVWAYPIANTTNADDFGYGIALDGIGNVLITGQYDGTCDFDPTIGVTNKTSLGGYDIFIAHYNNAGVLNWVNSIGGNGDDYGMHIIADNLSDVYVTGSFMGTADFDPGITTANLVSGGLSDIYIGKYNAIGGYVWAKNIAGTGDDLGNCVNISGSAIYLTGQFASTADFDPGPGTANLSSSGSWDIFFASYQTDGTYIWAEKAGGIGVDQSHVIDVDLNSSYFLIAGEFPNSVDFDPSGNTATLSSAGLDDIYFAKYDIMSGVGDHSQDPFSVLLFPNPATTNIHFSIISTENDFLLEIMNAEGRLVTRKNIGNDGTLDCSDLANGIYLIKILAGDAYVTRKLIINK